MFYVIRKPYSCAKYYESRKKLLRLTTVTTATQMHYSHYYHKIMYM
jgi:hypothetical protein